MTSFPRSSLVSVLLAMSLVSGCGDDEGGFTDDTTADAGGSSSTSGEPSATPSTSNGDSTTPADDNSTTAEADETSANETTASEDDSSDDATEGSELDGGDEPSPSEQDGSVTEDGNDDAGVETTTNPVSNETTGAEACGAEGDVCCAANGGGGFGGGGQGTCDEGLVCDNPQGNGLTDSECVVETPVANDAGGAGDAGGASDAGDVTSAAACGAQGEVCCAASGGGGFGGGGQGTCDEGLTCDNPAGDGLTNSECVAP